VIGELVLYKYSILEKAGKVDNPLSLFLVERKKERSNPRKLVDMFTPLPSFKICSSHIGDNFTELRHLFILIATF
jgi:hypothetical protein